MLASSGLGDALGPFVARTLPDRLELGGSVLVLFGAWWAMRALGERPGRVLFLACGAAWVGALAMRAAGVVFFALAGGVILRAAVRRPPSWRASVIFGVAGVLFFPAALFVTPRPSPDVTGGDPAKETRAALAAGNLFEARLWAERWAAATREQPGEPALVLAETDWELGHHARARAIVLDVSTRAPDGDVRRRASERLAQWNEPK